VPGDAPAASAPPPPRGLRREIGPRWLRGRLPTFGLAWFFQRRPRSARYLLLQMESVVRLNASLPAGLAQCAVDAPNRRVRGALQTLAASLEKGASLADSMRAVPKTFPGRWVDAVEAAERSGSLSLTLRRLASEAGEGLLVGRRTRNYLAYIFALMVLEALIMLFLAFRVIPVFAEILEEFEQAPPVSMSILVGISEFLRSHAGTVFMWAALALLLFSILKALHRRIGLLQSVASYAILVTPSFGSWYRQARVEHIAWLLEIAIAAGVPLPEALRNAAGAQGLAHPYQRTLKRLAADVERGSKLSTVLQSRRYLLGDAFREAVVIGEQREDLVWAFHEAGETARRRAVRLKNVWVQAVIPIGVGISAIGVGLVTTATMATFVELTNGLIKDL